MNSPVFDWIVFDLGGVIINLDYGYDVRKLLEQSGDNKAKVRSFFRERFSGDEQNLSSFEKYVVGKISTDDYIAQINKLIKCELSADEIRDIKLGVLRGENLEMLELLGQLKPRYQLACFSNTHAMHWDHIQDQYHCFKFFSIRLASHLVGFAKPDPRAFKLLCDTLQAPPKRCLFIDDSKANVAGARSSGLHAIYFDNPGQLKEELQSLGV